MLNKAINFAFRAISSDSKRFAKAKEQFDAAQVAYEAEKDDDGNVTSIKRSAVKVELPLPDFSEFSEGFRTNLIAGVLSEAVRKEFIDELKVVDVSVINAKWIESTLAAQRAAGIDSATVDKLAEVVGQVLKAAGKPEKITKLVTTLIKGKFNKKALDTYQQFKDKYVDVCSMIDTVIKRQSDELRAEFEPVLEAYITNLEKWIEESEKDADLELDLDLS